MSLLMEALRKAEEAKRRMQQEEQAATGKDSRETTSSQRETSSFRNAPSALTLEEREPEVTPEYIRDNFTTSQDGAVTASPQDEYSAEEDHVSAPEPEPQYTRPVIPAPAAARREQRATAASVFAAKQGPARNRNALTILVMVMVLMIPAGGGVLWYLQSASSSGIGLQPALANYDLSSRQLAAENTAPVPAGSPTEPAATGQNAVTETTGQAGAAAQLASAAEATAPAPATEAMPADEGAVAAGEEPAVEPQIAATESITAPAVTVPVPAEAPTATNVVPPLPAGPAIVAVNTPPAAPSTSVMEITRSRSANQVNPDLVIAYESLQSGDLPTARRLYEQLLNVLPNNRDAMLGLASINLREGNPNGARALYARLLQLNPRDALAQTGLLQTMQTNDPSEHERALKALISTYPDVAQLTLALGNHYASQQRWSEAQGAYYNALLTASRSTGGPVHPDYAFNLAVSLEQLNEPRAALDYYRRAQALATEITPGFDRQLLNSRLAYLEQAQP